MRDRSAGKRGCACRKVHPPRSTDSNEPPTAIGHDRSSRWSASPISLSPRQPSPFDAAIAFPSSRTEALEGSRDGRLTFRRHAADQQLGRRTPRPWTQPPRRWSPSLVGRCAAVFRADLLDVGFAGDGCSSGRRSADMIPLGRSHPGLWAVMPLNVECSWWGLAVSFEYGPDALDLER